jgi:regulator of sigma D
LYQLEKTNEAIIAELQTSGATNLVKGLQMIRLQKAILAVGMFSIFEAILQDRLGSENGLAEAKQVLGRCSNEVLLQKFTDYQCAINVLKHGKGRSYEYLVSRSSQLEFRIKLPDENFFNEGDVSEVTILVDVDDDFVMGCARVIENVSAIIKSERPSAFI